MSRFIKFIPSKEAMFLVTHKKPAYQNAFRLLTIIATNARRYNGHPDGLTIGQCHLGKWASYGMSEQNYKSAKKILEHMNQIKIIETNRTRKKKVLTVRNNFNSHFFKNPTIRVTTEGTLVELISSDIYDINICEGNDQSNDSVTTDQRLGNDELRMTKKEKNKKESHHPSIPSPKPADGKRDDGLMTDDFSFEKKTKTIEITPGIFLSQEELDACLKLKSTREKVRESIEYIQSSKKRKHPIYDWPNALLNWKIEDKTKSNLQDHIAYAENLCKEFGEYGHGNGWRCFMHKDTNKDQSGILFECSNSYQQSFFVALVDGEMKNKCEDFIKNRKMREIS